MNAQQTPKLTQAATLPRQVWQTLAGAQQEAVFQTMVRICSNLIEIRTQGESNEPEPGH